MVARRDERNRSHPPRREPPRHSLRMSDRESEPEPHAAQPLERHERAVRSERTATLHVSRDAIDRHRTIDLDLDLDLGTDFDFDISSDLDFHIRLRAKELERCAQISDRRTREGGSCRRIANEHRHVGATRRGLQDAVDDERVRSARDRKIDRALPRRRDDDTRTRAELARCDERLVTNDVRIVRRRHDARTLGSCAVGMTDQNDVPSTLYLAERPRDGNRRLPGAAERGAADRDETHVRRHVERTNDRARGDTCPSTRQKVGPFAAKMALFERVLNRAHAGMLHAEEMLLHLDPASLARAQLDYDVRATGRFEGLFERKLARVMVSAFAFLRGSAPLFYEILRTHPELARGPKGKGWITGDLHMENFGAYRTDDHDVKSRVAFGVNDFDEAVIGPWRLDVLRLTTSLLLATRSYGMDGIRSVDIAFSLLRGYASASSGGKHATKMPRPIAALIEQVRNRTRRELLDARTEAHRGTRRFVRGLRYRTVSKSLAAKGERAFAGYVASTLGKKAAKDGAFRVIDVAQRIAGTGSLGCLRLAILTEGKGGRDGSFIFDLKEQSASAAARLGRSPEKDPASRVVAAAHAFLEHPPRLLGVTRLAGMSMVGRRLAPQEDKLDLARATAAELADIARTVGAIAGAAHRRAATRPPKRPWTSSECEELLHNSIRLAGIHESAYLAYARLAGKKVK